MDAGGVLYDFIACEVEPYVTECITNMFMANKTELDFLMAEEALAAGVTEVRKPDDELLVDFVGRTEKLVNHVAASLIAAGNGPAFSIKCAVSLVSDDHGSSHGYYVDYFTMHEVHQHHPISAWQSDWTSRFINGADTDWLS